MRIRCYVSGPLTGGPDANLTEDQVRGNVQAAINAGRLLIEGGYAPLIPHLSWYVDPTNQYGHEGWLAVDFAWLSTADVMLRLPGASVGADLEEVFAKERGIPVVRSMNELMVWNMDNDDREEPPYGHEPKNILEEAHGLVYGARQTSYGHPRDNLGQTAAMWTAFLTRKLNGSVLTADDVAWMMVLLKASRDSHAPKRDNLVDGAGYLATIERCREDK